MLRRRIALFFAGAMMTGIVHAQALPTASRSLTLEAGLGATIASSDYAPKKIGGYTVFAAADLSGGLGLDLEYHDTNLFTPNDTGESTALGGLRYGRHERRFYPYVKVLAGIGTLTFQKGYFQTTTSYTYTALVLGGGLEYRAAKRLTVRAADFEYQDWTNFKPNSLSPIVFTVGAAYRY